MFCCCLPKPKYVKECAQHWILLGEWAREARRIIDIEHWLLSAFYGNATTIYCKYDLIEKYTPLFATQPPRLASCELTLWAAPRIPAEWIQDSGRERVRPRWALWVPIDLSNNKWNHLVASQVRSSIENKIKNTTTRNIYSLICSVCFGFFNICFLFSLVPKQIKL